MIGISERDQHIGIKKVDHALPVAMTRASSSSY
jgi:hypothetical protein